MPAGNATPFDGRCPRTRDLAHHRHSREKLETPVSFGMQLDLRQYVRQYTQQVEAQQGQQGQPGEWVGLALDRGADAWCVVHVRVSV